MKYLLGIDQGGTKTHAMVCDAEGTILGIGTADGACHSTNGMDTAMLMVSKAVDQAISAAGITLQDISMLGAGMTGVDWSDEADLLRAALHETLGIDMKNIIVVNDCIIAMRAATSNPSGAILCAGTGLNCAIRDGLGNEYTYGFYIPDEDQGGMALARRTLQAVYDAESGIGASTQLTDLVLTHMNCQSVDELLRHDVTDALHSKTVLQLPRVLEKAALNNDAVANEVLYHFAKDVSRYVTSGLKKLNLLNESIEVVLSGSVFKCAAPILLDTVRAEILRAAPSAVIIESVYEPIIGAILLALDAIGADPAVIQSHIRRDAQRFNMIRIP